MRIKVDGQKRWAKVEVTLTTGIKRWILLLSNNRGALVNRNRKWGFWHRVTKIVVQPVALPSAALTNLCSMSLPTNFLPPTWATAARTVPLPTQRSQTVSPGQDKHCISLTLSDMGC